jgi:hypothetical protein
MKSTVHNFVQSCQVCLQAKPDKAAYPGKLQPLPVPKTAWETISMDFIDGLPLSINANCNLVIVDKFTKYGHFIPLTHPYTARTVAQCFLANVYLLHGLPSAIISDHDPVFTSNFWKQLFKLTGTELHLSSAYHPQIDGQMERVNQCLEIPLLLHQCVSQEMEGMVTRYQVLVQYELPLYIGYWVVHLLKFYMEGNLAPWVLL